MESIKDYFNNLASKWDSICYHDINKLNTIGMLANIKQNDKVIDLACGTGIMFKTILQFNPQKILGVDIADKMVQIAKQKFNDNRIEIICSDIFDISVQDYDVAILYSAYPHFSDKSKLIRCVYNMLKSNGRFLIAHSESKQKINSIHKNNNSVSNELKSAKHEIKYFENLFDIDTLIDTNEFYIISGRKLSRLD